MSTLNPGGVCWFFFVYPSVKQLLPQDGQIGILSSILIFPYHSHRTWLVSCFACLMHCAVEHCDRILNTVVNFALQIQNCVTTSLTLASTSSSSLRIAPQHSPCLIWSDDKGTTVRCQKYNLLASHRLDLRFRWPFDRHIWMQVTCKYRSISLGSVRISSWSHPMTVAEDS